MDTSVLLGLHDFEAFSDLVFEWSTHLRSAGHFGVCFISYYA